MALEWKKDLETGFERIDDQHKLIIKKLGEFQKACEAGLGRNAVCEMFDFIERYVREHFTLEEAYMFGKRYAHFEDHRAAHEALRGEYKKLQAALSQTGVSSAVVVKANFFLGDWWREHICKVDKQMVELTR
jgi:hemerythrin-like metal-binding protein